MTETNEVEPTPTPTQTPAGAEKHPNPQSQLTAIFYQDQGSIVACRCGDDVLVSLNTMESILRKSVRQDFEEFIGLFANEEHEVREQ